MYEPIKESDQKFIRQNIHLDGRHFYSCEFTECTLFFSGATLPRLEHCKFYECTFRFIGAAESTLQFLGAMYSGGFKPLVEDIINEWKRNGEVSGGN
jgi:hypothetical protein